MSRHNSWYWVLGVSHELSAGTCTEAHPLNLGPRIQALSYRRGKFQSKRRADSHRPETLTIAPISCLYVSRSDSESQYVLDATMCTMPVRAGICYTTDTTHARLSPLPSAYSKVAAVPCVGACACRMCA